MPLDTYCKVISFPSHWTSFSAKCGLNVPLTDVLVITKSSLRVNWYSMSAGKVSRQKTLDSEVIFYLKHSE